VAAAPLTLHITMSAASMVSFSCQHPILLV
jgi:hypothetical protein